MKLIIRMLDPHFLTGLVFIVSIIFLLFIGFWRNRDYLIYCIFIFLILCASFILLNGIFKVFPLKVDSIEDYIPAGMTVANNLRAGVTGFVESLPRLIQDKFLAYTFWVGVIFAITGNSLIAASFLSSIFGALTIYMVFHIAKDIYDVRTARLTVLLLAISPFFIFISSVIMRDTMVTFFICWFYRTWLLYDKIPERKYLWLMTFILLATGLLRPPIMFVIIASIMIYKLFFEKRENQSRYFRMLVKYMKVVIVLFGLVLAVATVTKTIDVKAIIQSRLGSGLKYTEMEQINQRISRSESAGSYYYPVAKHDSPLTILTYLPLLVAYFMASPFPWQVHKMTALFAVMDSAVLWAIYLLFFMEIRSFIKRNKKWAVVLFSYIFLGVCASSIVQANVSAAQRHRIMFTVLILPFAVHRLVSWWYGERQKQKQGLAVGKVFKGRILAGPSSR